MDEENDNNVAENSFGGIHHLYFLITSAQIINVYVLRSIRQRPHYSEADLNRLGCLALPECVESLMSTLCTMMYPPTAAVLVTDDPGQPAGRFSMELVNDNERESITISNVSKSQVCKLICKILENPSNTVVQLMKLVDPCQCSHQFHQFARDCLLDFLSTPSAAWSSQLVNRASISSNRDPLFQVRWNSGPFVWTRMQFLMDFHCYLRSREDSAYNGLLLKMTTDAVSRALAHSRVVSLPPEILPDACQFANPGWPRVQFQTQISQEEAEPGYVQRAALLASRNQSDFSLFGAAAGMQCMAMSMAFIRLHHMLLGSFSGSLSKSILDVVLNIGHQLYETCIKANRLPNNQHLNFDELQNGMLAFDRHGGWPRFDPVVGESNPHNWIDSGRSVQWGFANGYDGFLLIMHGRAVAVTRDRVDSSQLFLFDSHGSDQFPASFDGAASLLDNQIEATGDSSTSNPAYALRCSSIAELVMNLCVMFQNGWPCEMHFYKCDE
ncbi:hypothetical protein BOX15_Mlig028667g1 [Macrostomum lignano]|uniref:Peptidase C76 domain-containing protein n=2 Tax=Macrostomum lignano TaxID=282301 RepID=A0A1I8G236_9PLAT|nr:hypothetical protein BOX15_Mlig028667g1 [Macrostomum lignano]